MKPHVPYRIVGVIRVDRTESVVWQNIVGRISQTHPDAQTRCIVRPTTVSVVQADQRQLQRELRQLLQATSQDSP